MENEYLLESARQLQLELGRENVIFIHVALLPFLGASKELKTKPIQHSVRTLMSYGINPDFLIVRADTVISEEILLKVAHSTGIHHAHVISAPTLDSIYRVPIAFADQGLGPKIQQSLSLGTTRITMEKWEHLLANIDASHEVIRLALVGKYVGLEDAYYSLNESLRAAGYAFTRKVKIDFIEAEDLEKNGGEILSLYDGIVVPGGFGDRGIEGMIRATEFARVNKVPFLGICLGSQIMAIEFARNVLHLEAASSEEFHPDGRENIIHIMQDQKTITDKGATMRLGNYPCIIRPGTQAAQIYGTHEAFERHRHRYEFNPQYREKMEKAGFIVSATSPDGQLAEIVEVRDHPFMIGTQAHPELASRPFSPHPLFRGLIQAILRRS
jgi:CTP synthase